LAVRALAAEPEALLPDEPCPVPDVKFPVTMEEMKVFLFRRPGPTG
jgi:ABC-type taurine transport system ATPase subunit